MSFTGETINHRGTQINTDICFDESKKRPSSRRQQRSTAKQSKTLTVLDSITLKIYWPAAEIVFWVGGKRMEYFDVL